MPPPAAAWLRFTLVSLSSVDVPAAADDPAAVPGGSVARSRWHCSVWRRETPLRWLSRRRRRRRVLRLTLVSVGGRAARMAPSMPPPSLLAVLPVTRSVVGVPRGGFNHGYSAAGAGRVPVDRYAAGDGCISTTPRRRLPEDCQAAAIGGGLGGTFAVDRVAVDRAVCHAQGCDADADACGRARGVLADAGAGDSAKLSRSARRCRRGTPASWRAPRRSSASSAA